jgi:hypothetical protein
VPVKFVSCTLILASALLAAACGHQGMTESTVRTQVRRFMSLPGGYLKIVAVPSCAKADRKNEWQCRVRVLMPSNGDRFDLTVTASCAAKRCELARNDWTGYGPSNAPWIAVINDWYDGGIDHRHSCSAVRAAVDHLPKDAPEVGAGIRAYERKVC